MTNATTAAPMRKGRRDVHVGAVVPFDMLRSAGAYVCNWSGNLLRIPPRTTVPSEALGTSVVGRRPLTVTKISEDPGISLIEARRAAARLGIRVGF